MLKELTEAIEEGDEEKAEDLCRSLLNKGVSLEDVINSMQQGTNNVGKKFEEGKAFLPDLIMTGNAFISAMEVVRPYLKKAVTKSLGKVILGTVQGDVHYIGKRLVAIALESNGFEVVDLGEDVQPRDFAEAVERMRPDILGISCLLSTTASNIPDVIKELERRGIREKVKVMIGGAAVDDEFRRMIGADAYAPDAFKAVDVARRLLGR